MSSERTAAEPAGTPAQGWLSGDDLATLRDRLVGERAQLLEQIRVLEADFADESWAGPRAVDEAEGSSVTVEREQVDSLARNARRMVAEVDRALERMDAGTYGLCLSCGQPIALERLQALPQATQCVDCRRRAERTP